MSRKGLATDYESSKDYPALPVKRVKVGMKDKS
jgi:hypothetical protein